MAKKAYDAVATVGEYTDREGNKKKRYMNVGTVFQNDEGQLSMKLDAIPISKDWSGFINFYPPKDRTVDSTPASRKMHGSAPNPGHHQQDDDGDSIPF
jgi:hypothetical protein